MIRNFSPESSLEITEGIFTDVPIHSLQEPEPGKMSYYSSDILYSNINVPPINVSSLLRGRYEIDPFTVEFTFFDLEFSEGTASVEGYNSEGSQYNFVNNKVSVKTRVLVGLDGSSTADFELWVNQAPVQHLFPPGDPGVLMYNIEGTEFVSTNINSYLDPLQGPTFDSQNSDGSVTTFNVVGFWANKFRIYSGDTFDEYRGASRVIDDGQIPSTSFYYIGFKGEFYASGIGDNYEYFGTDEDNDTLIVVGTNIPKSY